jgi:hypothetical protein
VATVAESVAASAPGYTACTFICGGVTAGYSFTGRIFIDIIPASIINTDITVANIGLFIKNFENI